jgi:hypothetical protein
MVFDQAGGPRLNVRAPLAQAGGGDQVQNSQQPYEMNDQAASALAFAPGPQCGPKTRRGTALDCSDELRNRNHRLQADACKARGYTVLERSDAHPTQPMEVASSGLCLFAAMANCRMMA